MDNKDRSLKLASKLIDVVPVPIVRKRILELVSILNQKKDDSFNLTEKFIEGYKSACGESAAYTRKYIEIETIFIENYNLFKKNLKKFESDSKEDIKKYLDFYRQSLFTPHKLIEGNDTFLKDFSRDIFNGEVESYDKEARKIIGTEKYIEIKKIAKKIMDMNNSRQ